MFGKVFLAYTCKLTGVVVKGYGSSADYFYSLSEIGSSSSADSLEGRSGLTVWETIRWLQQKDPFEVDGHWFIGKLANMAAFFSHHIESCGK